MTKIYTRTGDDGTTGLLGARRVPKHDARIEAYGTVDELNAHVGLALVAVEGLAGASRPDLRDGLAGELLAVQARLFDVGALLAAPPDTAQKLALAPVEASWIEMLEAAVDRAETHLPPLRAFVLPGGDEAAARLHVARAVCRRAERRVTALAAECEVPDGIVRYLNRLSDYLFVMARLCLLLVGRADVPWQSAGTRRRGPPDPAP